MCFEVKYFLVNDDYINYLLDATPELVVYWEAYFNKYPDQRPAAQEAAEILLAKSNVECSSTAGEVAELKNRIVSSIKEFSRLCC